MFNSTVMDHFQNPRHTGEIAEPDGIAEVSDPTCGDAVRFYIRVENDRLTEIKHKTFGCAGAIAACSAVSEIVDGKTLGEAALVTPEMVDEKLAGLPESKEHCAILAAKAVLAVLRDYRKRRESRLSDA